MASVDNVPSDQEMNQSDVIGDGSGVPTEFHDQMDKITNVCDDNHILFEYAPEAEAHVRAVPHYEALQEYLDGMDGVVLIIKDSDNVIGISDVSNEIVMEGNQVVPTQVACMEGAYQITRNIDGEHKRVRFDRMFVMTGPDDENLIVEHYIKDHTNLEIVSIGEHSETPHGFSKELAMALNPPKVSIQYYVGSVPLLVQVFRSPTIPIPSKIITALYCLFPHVRKFIQNNFRYVGTGGLQPAVLRASAEDLNSSIVAVAALCCLGAYPHSKKVSEQLNRRYRALCADVGMVAVEEAKYTLFFNRFSLAPADLPGEVIDAIAHVIAIDQDGNFDHRVSAENLMSAEDVATRYNLTTLARGILSQMRLVFTNFRLTTLHFGFRVLDSASALGTRVSKSIEQQFANLKKLQESIGNSPYAGISATTPDVQQVAKNATPCLIGVLYHEKNLKNDVDKTSFKEFNQAGIREHITNQKDLAICAAIANTMSETHIDATSSMIDCLPVHQAENLLVKLTEDEKEAVYNHLKAQKSKSAWFQAEQSRRTRVVYTKYLANATNYYNQQLATYVTQLTQLASAYPTQEERQLELAKIATWKTQVSMELSQIITIHHATGPLQHLSEVETHQVVAKNLARVHALLSKGSSLNEDQLKKAAKEALKAVGIEDDTPEQDDASDGSEDEEQMEA